MFGQGKSVPLIAMAHGIPYVATASVADLHDLEYKVNKAMRIHGARYIHVQVPCPLGWGSESHDTIQVARIATESGVFPMFEAEYGVVTGSRKIRNRVPVVEYLKLQKRYAHLFREWRRAPPRTAAGKWPTATSQDSICSHTRDMCNAQHPLPSHSTSARASPNQTGSWRNERPIYVDRLPPCNNACPAGRNIQGWLCAAETGDYETAWRVRPSTIPCRPAWDASAITLAKASVIAPTSTAPSASIPSSAFSAIRQSKMAGSSKAPKSRAANAC